MSKLSRIRTAQVALFAVLGASAPASAEFDYYDGIDINQRVIDGQREPINKYLLKRRGATQRPDPAATGTINTPEQRPAEKPPTIVQP